MPTSTKKKPHGEIRQSQLLTTYGPGAMVDLPKYSVLVGGLESWSTPQHTIHEERLEAKAAEMLGIDKLTLHPPPSIEEATDGSSTGIAVWRFPEWFVASNERRSERTGHRARPIVHITQLTDGRFLYDKKKHPVVPIRFVCACPRGHLSDIAWRAFAHGNAATCQRQLWLEEQGTTGHFDELAVVCECGASRSMRSAYPTEGRALPLGPCAGERPWLGKVPREQCLTEKGAPMPARLLVRSASNAYYSQTLSVIHIPDHNAAVVDAVDKVWDDFLQYVETPGDLANEKKKAKVAAALEGLDEAAVMQDIERRKGNLGPTTKNLKSIEFETICRAPKELSEDVPDADFYAREFTPAYAPVWFKEKIDRVVLVHRLREVRALLGFTRLDPVAPDLDGELNLPELRRAALALDTKWLPAVETRGEGFFMSFNSQALSAWVSRPGVQSRLSDLQRGFAAWATRQGFKDMKAPGPRLTLLHSLSHLLITSISLEAGYSASSIRERIYVGDTGAGILLYTGSSDSEGTLGGLVDVGRRIGQHLEQALELGRLCSNDPVCADHAPDNNAEERYLHGASCHGCLLIAEPSCELRNEFLDRALVVPTVGTPDAAFFEDAGAL